MSESTTCAALLAGGRSKRMGHAKHDIQIDGKPMLQIMAELALSCCDDLIIAGPPGLLPEYHHASDVPEHQGFGPLAGIEAALLSGRGNRWLILPCDMPRLRSSDLVTLLQHAATICCFSDPKDPDRMLNLPMALDASHVCNLTQSLDAGIRSVGRWLTMENAAMVAPLDPVTTINLNTPEDVEQIQNND